MQVPTIPNLIHYAIPFFIITIVIEISYSVNKNLHKYETKDAITSIALGLGNVAIGLLSKGFIFWIYFGLYQFRFFNIPFVWWSWLLLLFLDDFSYYWFHRTSHTVRFFWASHIVHHSSKKYNLTTALRQTWTGDISSFLFWAWLPILGFHPYMILAQMSISLIYQYWIHTEVIKKMPKWFEAIFNTPSHHRVHHATNPQYLDRNHAGIFIIWDKLFGTFEPEKEKPVYGLIHNINSFNPVKIAFYEWYYLIKEMINSKTTIFHKLQYLSKPPGWKHDGTGKLSTDFRKEWKEQSKSLNEKSC